MISVMSLTFLSRVEMFLNFRGESECQYWFLSRALHVPQFRVSYNAIIDLCQELDMSLILGLVIMLVLISVKRLTCFLISGVSQDASIDFCQKLDMSLNLGLVYNTSIDFCQGLTCFWGELECQYWFLSEAWHFCQKLTCFLILGVSQNASADFCQELDMSIILGLVIMPVLISVKSLTFLSRVDMFLNFRGESECQYWFLSRAWHVPNFRVSQNASIDFCQELDIFVKSWHVS